MKESGTKRTKSTIPGLQRHRSKWRWRRMVEGRRVIIQLQATTEDDAIREVEILRSRSQSSLLNNWDETVGHYLASRHHGRRLSDATIKSRGPVLYAVGRDMQLLGPLSLTPAVAQRWLDSLIRRVEARKEKEPPEGIIPISEETLSHYVRDLRSFVKWCVTTHRMTADPTKDFDLTLKQARKRYTFVPAKRLAELLEKARQMGHRNLEFVLALASECAMRRSEIDAARPEWFDLDHRVVIIPPEEELFSETGTHVFQRKGKEGQRRGVVVPLSDTMLEIIRRHGLPSPFLIEPEKTTRGKNRYRFEFKNSFNSFMEANGHADVTLHDLRRSFASNKVSAGVPLDKVANWMGINPKTAWGSYSRFLPRDEEINKGSAPLPREEPAPIADAPLSVAERLHRLDSLVRQGIISGEERAAQRSKILADL